MTDTPDRPDTPPPTEHLTPPPTEHLPPRPDPGLQEDGPQDPGPPPPGRWLPAADELPVVAAVALVAAVGALAFGALLLASSFDGVEEEWKATVKIIGLSVFGGLHVGIGLGTNALFAAGLLLVALTLVRREVAPHRAGLVPLVAVGALAVAAWLAFFTVIGIAVDLTELGDDFVAAFGVLVSDLATLLVLALTGLWGYNAYHDCRAGRAGRAA